MSADHVGMCFLLLHHRARPGWPLVLLANRDEYFDHPFDGPALRDDEHGIVAPRDLRAGGTWLGMNRHGVVAAITNRGGRSPDGVRSRGQLVQDALRHTRAVEGVAWAREHLAETAYAGFNLLLADRSDAVAIRHAGASEAVRPAESDVATLTPGAHALSNLHDLDEVPVPAAGLVGAPEEAIESVLERLTQLARDDTTELPGGHRILKRAPNRGTVCSALHALPASAGEGEIFRFAGGAPDQTAFQPVS